MKPKILLLMIGVALATAAWPGSVLAQQPPPGKAAPGIIQPDVYQQLTLLGQQDYLRIVIRLADQVTAPERAEILQARAMARDPETRALQRRTLASALRANAQRTQAPILDRLRNLEARDLARNIRPLWIANVIGAEVKPAAIEEIATWDGIEYVKQDVKRPAFQASSAWGVAKVQADSVWPTLGVNGDGVVVAVLDSGVDLEHPDLVNNLWINPGEDNGDGQFTAADNNGIDNDGNGYVDDVVGWDLGKNDNSPDDWHGHGTHVAGTVAGDGTGGTATGVAPGARIMVLSYSADPDAGQAEAWEGIQYALDNGADIVNFSSGFKDAWSPDYKTWRDTTDVLTDGGVFFVVAAGNDGPHVPVPGDVLTPARAPRALAVGATDDTDLIADFSGMGPSSWQSVTGYNDYIYPPGLLKPDVSAPGVAVTSTKNGGGYVNGATWSGTSMAAPHAAGTAALLLDEDPALLPHELAYILRETAVDLGTAGADNVCGYGRINALAAVSHAYSHTPAYDLSVTGTTSEWTTVDIWVDNNDDGTPDTPHANTTNHLYARIRNLEGQAVGNVEIKLYYADVGTLGIAGFDPNGDGDPADGNFTYIDSYFVPVIGPAGSSQAVAVGVVNWNVPVPVTDHWCVGVGIVAPNPPNATEGNRGNNRAFRNFFDIILLVSQKKAFDFFVYPDPRRPLEPFDLELVRQDLPRGYEVELAVDRAVADQWFRRLEGLEAVERPALKNMPPDPEGPRYVRLARERGILRGIVAPQGKPVRVTALLQAPDRAEGGARGEAALVVNAVNEQGAFGGMTFRLELATGEEAEAKEPCGPWTLRLAGVYLDPTGDAGFEADRAQGFGLALERRLGQRWGVELGTVLFTKPDVELRLDAPARGREDLSYRQWSLGFNLHLTPGRPSDLYLGPLFAYVTYGDLDLEDRLETDNDFASGLQIGVDRRFGDGCWAFHASLRYLETAVEIPDTGAKLDFDPLALAVGIAYRF